MMNTKLDNNLQDELDHLMQEGYEHVMSGNSISACQVWIECWNKMKDTMGEHDIESIEDLDNSFDGLQYIYNWASDFELELENAAIEDKSFAQIRIDFCNEYIARYRDKNDLNIYGMKRAIAESYFVLGKNDEGERLFKEFLEQSPTWGWSWIGWSDQYWLSAQEQNKNSDKAIQILKQALEVEGLKDRFDVLDRLGDLYAELEMHQESAEVRQQIIVQVKANQSRRSKVSLPPIKKAVPITSTKIGRNDPCPCGSGKKYKKCCGK